MKLVEYEEFNAYKTLHDWYLRRDVAGLADVFEDFRTECLRDFGLDPAHYIGMAQLAWDVCLRIAYNKYGVELENITDQEMYMMFEKAKRGGMSKAVYRHVCANHPYLRDYNLDQEHQWIHYIDMNNLYGGAMMKPLPVFSNSRIYMYVS